MSREGLLPYLDADSKSDLNSQLIPRSPDTQTRASLVFRKLKVITPEASTVIFNGLLAQVTLFQVGQRGPRDGPGVIIFTWSQLSIRASHFLSPLPPASS